MPNLENQNICGEHVVRSCENSNWSSWQHCIGKWKIKSERSFSANLTVIFIYLRDCAQNTVCCHKNVLNITVILPTKTCIILEKIRKNTKLSIENPQTMLKFNLWKRKMYRLLNASKFSRQHLKSLTTPKWTKVCGCTKYQETFSTFSLLTFNVANYAPDAHLRK